MAFVLEENRLMVFANKDRKSLKSPLVTGKANVEGLEVKLAGWKAKEGEGIVGKLSVKSDNGFSHVGSLAFADVEKTKENSPDKLGSLTLNNKEFRVALWKKEGKVGTYLAGTLQDPDKAIEKKNPKGTDGKTPLPQRGEEEDIF